MKHLRSINRKAGRIEQSLASWTGPTAGGVAEHASSGVERGAVAEHASGGAAEPEAGADVVALQQGPTPQPAAHIPLGCTLVFSPGWEADRTGGTAGLCTPVERDLFDCHAGCYWPAQVPDQLNHAANWTAKCASAQKDWRKIDLVFP